MVTTFKRLRNIAVGTALVLSSVSAFAEGAPFTIDPTAYTTGGSVFTATQLGGNSSVLLTNIAGTFNYVGVGYLQYTGASGDNGAVSTKVSGLNYDYGLYATFTQTFSCTGLVTSGVKCATTSISLNVYIDSNANDTFTNAKLTGSTGTAPVVGGVTSDDVLLGTVDTIIAGTATVDVLGNAAQTVNTNFILTAAGSAYFIGPVPFYTLAMSQFGNSSGGALCYPNCGGATVVAIVNEQGSTTFNGVPEPMPLALMGLGMLGMVAFRRKQAKK